jgi:peptide/nickel transport system substrate-binding protein
MRRLFFAVLCALFFADCSDPPPLEVGEGASFAASAENIPGTRRVELPLKWEIGRPGGTWYDTYMVDPKSYNPFSNLDGSHRSVTGFMLDYLFDYDTDTREWSGHLVESFEVVADEGADTMELRCRLREDVFWSDGVQMTADDMLFWYDEIDGDKDIYPVGYTGQFVKMDDGTQRRIIMKKTGRFDFTYIFPRVVQNPCLMVNAGSMVPRHIWEPARRKGKDAVRDLWGLDTPPEKLVGNGPFLLEKYTPGERIILKKNPRYWKRDEAGARLPYIDRIIMTMTADPNAELLKFQTGEIDSYVLRGKDIATLLPEAQAKDYSIWNGGPSNAYSALLFNENPAKLGAAKLRWFTNPDFRRAVSSLIDREAIVNLIMNGLSSAQYHIISEFNLFHNPALATPYSYNPEGARELFIKAGFHYDGAGRLLDEENVPVSFDIMTSSQDPLTHDSLNIIIQDLGFAGVKASLQVVDPNLRVQKLINTFEWDCTLAAMSFPLFPEQWYNVWLSSGNLHYWNPKQSSPALAWEKRIDELYEALIHTYNPEKVQALYDEFQEILVGNLLIIPISRSFSFTAVYNRWANVNWDTRHDIGDGFRRIFLREK